MEKKVLFEKFLFEGGNEIVIDDIEFCVDRIVMLPKIRPHNLEKAVNISVDYCKLEDFRKKITEKISECPVLIYQLHKRGILKFEEIEPFLRSDNAFLECYYFRKEFYDFDSFIRRKPQTYCFDESFLENENDIDQLIEYGYLPSSIEYYLKYDVIDDLLNIDDLNQEAKWSPFEWSYEPKHLDLLSFAGFFGSIKCFKHLIINGYNINENIINMVVCSGCLDLFHLCKNQQVLTPEMFCHSSEFFHIPLLVFFKDNGLNINAKTNDVELHKLMIHLFILLQKMAILVS